MSTLRDQFHRLPLSVQESLRERFFPKMLPEGETAPEWHLQSWDNSWHRQGKHWSVMVFYVQDGGTQDREQLLAFQKLLPEFERLKVKVFGFNSAEAESHAAFAEEAGITFPLLTDRGGSVARQFRACLQLPLRPVFLRTVYLVNPERKLRLGNRGNPSVEAILRSVAALQQVSKTGM
jgi:peroxiredoxin Q/BCP